MSRASSLPIELWEVITRYAEPETKKDLRAVCKELSKLCPDFEEQKVVVRAWRVVRGKHGKAFLFKETKAVVYLPNYMPADGVREHVARLFPVFALNENVSVALDADGNVLSTTPTTPLWSLVNLQTFCLFPASVGNATTIKLLRTRSGIFEPIITPPSSKVSDLLTKAAIPRLSLTTNGVAVPTSEQLPQQAVLYAA
ncbi:hypothetical protein DIPPA_35635 [Diplonema papillatum]|nr:hypothetical protein DIPPA_35635 [Diplonema papillatum]